MYLTIFIVGAGFILLSVIFGEVFEFGGVGFAFLQPTAIALALAVMGGVGLILSPSMGSYLALPFSAAAGIAAGFFLSRFVITPLRRTQHTSAYDKQALIGTTAKVVLTIPQGGFGKIKYNVTGSYVTGPAKSDCGNLINKDTEVVIAYFKDNTYYVKERSGPGGTMSQQETPNSN